MFKQFFFILLIVSALLSGGHNVWAQRATSCESCNAFGTATCSENTCKAIRPDCVFIAEPLGVGGKCTEPSTTQTTSPSTTSTSSSSSILYEPLADLPLIGDENGAIEVGKGGFTRYLDAMLKIGIALATILAVIVIVMGGLQYMTTGSVTGKSSGKDKLRNALFGLLLALGAFILLYTINPELLRITSLEDIHITVRDDAFTGHLNKVSYCYLRGSKGDEIVDCEKDDGTEFRSIEECREEWNKLSNPLAPCGVHETIYNWCYLNFDRDGWTILTWAWALLDDNDFKPECHETENICSYYYNNAVTSFGGRPLQSCQRGDVGIAWCFPEQDGDKISSMCFTTKAMCEEVVMNDDLEIVGEKVCQEAQEWNPWKGTYTYESGSDTVYEETGETQAICEVKLDKRDSSPTWKIKDVCQATNTSGRKGSAQSVVYAQKVAQQILAGNAVTLHPNSPVGSSGTDGADAKSNVQDAARGYPARTSCYGNGTCETVHINPQVLQTIYLISLKHSLTITSIAGGSHSESSKHYAGNAFDLGTIDGKQVNDSNPLVEEVKQLCKYHGAKLVLGPGDRGHNTHIHCEW